MISQYSTSVYTLGCMGLQRESLEYIGIVLAIIPLMCGYSIIVQVTEETTEWLVESILIQWFVGSY